MTINEEMLIYDVALIFDTIYCVFLSRVYSISFKSDDISIDLKLVYVQGNRSLPKLKVDNYSNFVFIMYSILPCFMPCV